MAALSRERRSESRVRSRLGAGKRTVAPAFSRRARVARMADLGGALALLLRQADNVAIRILDLPDPKFVVGPPGDEPRSLDIPRASPDDGRVDGLDIGNLEVEDGTVEG